ncbi:glycosyltransferase family 2 protein [Candidatus Berkelbacteria bacterium]|nr:glycosyltransferase family 2 protein [Candidatus Berkelbacteria bacterium]
MTKPMVSIVIVNLNGAAFLTGCLNSVAKLTHNPSFEVIIVDNGSSDHSKRLIERFSRNKRLSVKAIFNKANIGFCEANNQGAQAARGEFLLFLNNDTEVPQNLLAVLVAKLRQDPTIGIIQPKILLKDRPDHLDSVGGFLTWTGFLNHVGIHEADQGQYDREFPVFSPKGACMMMRTKLFTKVGGFDTDFFAYFEETDLAWRVWLVGKRVVFYPSVAILHLMGRTTRTLEFNFIQFHSYKNRIASLIKNVDTVSIWRVFAHIIIVIGLAMFYLLIGKWSSSRPIWRALGWNIRNLGATLGKRRTVGHMRRINDSFLRLVSKSADVPKAIHDVFYLNHEN